jgi:hypothetical protein
MSEAEFTIIEINGVKMEVDLRRAKIVHSNLRVGSKVKVLVKGTYDGPKVWPGVIVGFDAFKEFPTIQVAYISNSYASAELCFAAVNAKSAEKFEIVPAQDDDLPIERGFIMEAFDRDIVKKRREIEDVEAKRDYFSRMFGVYFKDAETATA